MWQRLKIPTLAKPFEAWQLEEVVEFAAMLIEHSEGSFKGRH